LSLPLSLPLAIWSSFVTNSVFSIIR
jgi:hypothetical protein